MSGRVLLQPPAHGRVGRIDRYRQVSLFAKLNPATTQHKASIGCIVTQQLADVVLAQSTIVIGERQ